MKVTQNETTITVEMTLERLAAMQSWGQKLFATPTTSGKISEVYWAASPKFTNDYPVANVGDFLEAAGYDNHEIDPETVQEMGDETYTLTINA